MNISGVRGQRMKCVWGRLLLCVPYQRKRADNGPERSAEEPSTSLFHKLRQNPHKGLSCREALSVAGPPEDVYDCR